MNCVRCDYLLWNLPENRCPECGLTFEATDYAFPRQAVAFICRRCEQSYLGTDEQGLPTPRRFECVKCHEVVHAADMLVRPLREEVHGDPLRMGTPWEQRRRVGFFRAFLDGVARLAMQPGEYFRHSSAAHNHGEGLFSILCAYIAAAVFLASIFCLQGGGLLKWLPDVRSVLTPRLMVLVLAAVPMIQLVWNYLYGLLIESVLMVLGRPGPQLELSVRAVAFGSAVLPAVLLFAPIGIVWYINVVSSGVENLHGTSRGQALAACLIPLLLAGNLLLCVTYALA